MPSHRSRFGKHVFSNSGEVRESAPRKNNNGGETRKNLPRMTNCRASNYFIVYIKDLKHPEALTSPAKMRIVLFQ